MKPKTLPLLATLVFGLLGGCIQFKVDDLTPEAYAKIKLGNTPDSVEGIVQNNVLVNIPLRIPVHSGFLYVPDLKNSVLKIFDKTGKLEKVLGNPDYKMDGDAKFNPVSFGVLGQIAVESDEEIYIQNRVLPGNTLDKKNEINAYKMNSGNFETSGSSSLPSFLLRINSDGITKDIIGVSGKNSEPFRFIENIYSSQNGKLFVFHRITEEMRLGYYQDGELKGAIRESKLDIFNSRDSKEYQILLDTMIPHRDGQYALASFSFFSKKDKRFKFRRIYKLGYDSETTGNPLKEIQDPAEILFSVQRNGEFYLWETEDKGNSIRLQVHSADGIHINNKRLSFESPRSQWRETFVDSNDELYSIKIKSGFLELYLWK